MKLRNWVSSALMAVSLASPVFAADSTTESEDPERREWMDLKRQELAADERDRLIHHVMLVVYLAVVTAFMIVYLRIVRRSLANARRALELAEQQQKTLEEIRDLLKKQ